MTKTDMDKQIKNMLDNTILDWNRASQLTTIDAKANYDSLIPAIKSLILEVVEAVTPAEIKGDMPSEDRYDDGYNWGVNATISEIKSKASELLG